MHRHNNERTFCLLIFAQKCDNLFNSDIYTEITLLVWCLCVLPFDSLSPHFGFSVAQNEAKQMNVWRKIVISKIYAKFIDFSFVALLITCDKDSSFNSMSENKHLNDGEKKNHQRHWNDRMQNVKRKAKKAWLLGTIHFYSKWKLNGEFISL